jgi:FMN phosphatase YigB (HAD superfamily)
MIPLRNRPEVTTVLWDLDGTLIRVHRSAFAALMPLVAAAAFVDMLPPWRFLTALRQILPQVRANDGQRSNHELLLALIAVRTGRRTERVDARLRWLSRTGFPLLRWCFRPRREAPQLVAELARRGVAQVVATNPLWPLKTVLTRLAWAGINADRFAFIAAGETMSRSKPRVDYYRELLEKLGVRPHQCVMIGNDARNDAPASALGIPVYLIDVDPRKSIDHTADPALLTTGQWAGLPAWLGV